MKVTTSKSKNSESFYITKGYINDKGVSTSVVIRKLGTLNGLLLEPVSKRSSFRIASEFLEKPSYELHDIYRALDVLGNECDFIQSEVYKNSHFTSKRNDKILYYGCEQG